MSKSRMPESMDLLLDTMCNTFGGVVFIALTLSLAFFVSRSQSSPANDLEKLKQELKEQQQENLTLKEKHRSLTKKLSSVKEFSSQYTKTKTDLPELVARLEQDCKDLQRDAEIQKMAQADLAHKMKKIEMENKEFESEIHKKAKEVTEKNKTLTEKLKRCCFIIDELNERLRKTPAKKFHFAHNERTSNSPYVLFIKNDHLYRLGRNYLTSSREVNVKRSGNKLLLTGVDGTWLSSISSSDLKSLLQDFDKSTSFLWIMVHPDSFNSFVNFRRLLRDAAFPVHWYINANSILYLADDANYYSSY